MYCTGFSFVKPQQIREVKAKLHKCRSSPETLTINSLICWDAIRAQTG
jgi:hypothetical protein